MEEDKPGSAWNMAQGTLERTNALVTAATFDAAHRNITNWLLDLEGLNREIWPWLSEKERWEVDCLFRYSENLIGSFSKRFPKPFKEGKFPSLLKKIVDDLDLYLRCKLKEYGFLLPSTEDPRFAMKNG